MESFHFGAIREANIFGKHQKFYEFSKKLSKTLKKGEKDRQSERQTERQTEKKNRLTEKEEQTKILRVNVQQAVREKCTYSNEMDQQITCRFFCLKWKWEVLG